MHEGTCRGFVVGSPWQTPRVDLRALETLGDAYREDHGAAPTDRKREQGWSISHERYQQSQLSIRMSQSWSSWSWVCLSLGGRAVGARQGNSGSKMSPSCASSCEIAAAICNLDDWRRGHNAAKTGRGAVFGFALDVEAFQDSMDVMEQASKPPSGAPQGS